MKEFDTLLQKSLKIKIPISVLLELTYRCNFNCIHCFYRDAKSSEELNTCEITSILKELKESGTIFITLSGGEVFLRKDIISIINSSIDLGFFITVFTNGSLINSKLLEKIPKSIYFEISIYPERISGFDKEEIFEKLLLLKKYGFKFTAKVILLKGFKGEYMEIIKFLKDENINTFVDFFIFPPLSKIEIKNLIVEENEISELSRYFPELFEKFREKYFRHGEENLCSAGSRFFSIDPYGNIFPCPFYRKKCGNVRDRKIKDIWEKSKVFEEIRNLKIEDWEECKRCEFSNICRRCPALSLLTEDSIHLPSTLNCLYTKITSKISRELEV